MHKDAEKLMYTDSFGDTFEVFPKIGIYGYYDNIYLGLDGLDKTISDVIEPYCDITTNICPLPYLYGAIDITFGGEEKLKFLERNGFGKRTGQTLRSGFCEFPVFVFNEDKLRQIDPKVFAEYAKVRGKDKPALDSKISDALQRASRNNSAGKEQEPER